MIDPADDWTAPVGAPLEATAEAAAPSSDAVLPPEAGEQADALDARWIAIRDANIRPYLDWRPGVAVPLPPLVVRPGQHARARPAAAAAPRWPPAPRRTAGLQRPGTTTAAAAVAAAVAAAAATAVAGGDAIAIATGRATITPDTATAALASPASTTPAATRLDGNPRRVPELACDALALRAEPGDEAGDALFDRDLRARSRARVPDSVRSASVRFMSPGCSGCHSTIGFLPSAWPSSSTRPSSVVVREPPRL